MHIVENKTKEIDYGAVGEDAILQNVFFLMNTYSNSCPLNREFGWTPALDEPIAIARVKNANRLTEAITNYIPNVEVIKIEYTDSEEHNIDGRLPSKVRLKIKSESI